MILKAKIRRFGNSLGLILPREALARLDLREGDTLFLTETAENGYRLTAGDPDFARQVQAVAGLSRRYRDALQHLAR